MHSSLLGINKLIVVDSSKMEGLVRKRDRFVFISLAVETFLFAAEFLFEDSHEKVVESGEGIIPRR